MNGKYEACLMVFSLREMCALKVAQNVATAVGLDDSLCLYSLAKTDETKAFARVRALPITRQTMETVDCFIRPTMLELYSWLSWNKQLEVIVIGDPIFTSYGTIDMTRSVNAILSDEKTDNRTRYMLACGNCCEEVIAEMHKVEQRDSLDNMRSFSPFELPAFWRDAFSGCYGELVDGRHLPQSVYDIGFHLALGVGNDVAVKYFIGKASPEVMRIFICHADFLCFDDDYRHLHKMRLSPPVFWLLFSKLSEDQQLAKRTSFSYLLLKSLLDWPYQCFFLEAMNELASHLDDFDYWKILATIIENIVNKARDFNYRRLFAGFWHIGSGLRINTPLCCHMFSENVYRVLKIEDEALINFMLSELTNEEKDELLMEFEKNMICARLMGKKRFRPLQLFIRGCCMGRKDVLLKFKTDFLQVMSISVPRGMPECCLYMDITRQELEVGLLKFIKIIADCMDQKRNSDAMEQN